MSVRSQLSRYRRDELVLAGAAGGLVVASAAWLVLWLESVYLWFTLEPTTASLPVSVLCSILGLAGILTGLLILDREGWGADA